MFITHKTRTSHSLPRVTEQGWWVGNHTHALEILLLVEDFLSSFFTDEFRTLEQQFIKCREGKRQLSKGSVTEISEGTIGEVDGLLFIQSSGWQCVHWRWFSSKRMKWMKWMLHHQSLQQGLHCTIIMFFSLNHGYLI